jgi:hypothetical protein
MMKPKVMHAVVNRRQVMRGGAVSHIRDTHVYPTEPVGAAGFTEPGITNERFLLVNGETTKLANLHVERYNTFGADEIIPVNTDLRTCRHIQMLGTGARESQKNNTFQLEREPISHCTELLEVVNPTVDIVSVGPGFIQGIKPIRRQKS